MLKKILVALDHSAFSQKTFMQSLVLAKATHAKLMLFHVISSTEEGYPPYPLMPGVLEEFDLSYAGVANSYLNDLDVFKASSLELLRSRANQAKEKGLTVVYQQSMGDPGREICEIALDNGKRIRSSSDAAVEIFLAKFYWAVLATTSHTMLLVQC